MSTPAEQRPLVEHDVHTAEASVGLLNGRVVCRRVADVADMDVDLGRSADFEILSDGLEPLRVTTP